MGRWGTLLVVGVVAIGLAAPLFGRSDTVTGVVIDLSCYARNRANTVMDHDQGRQCAWACIKYEGQPAGLLTSDGKVYQLTGALAANNNARIAEHVGHTVAVTGEVSEQDGMLMLSSTEIRMAGN